MSDFTNIYLFYSDIFAAISTAGITAILQEFGNACPEMSDSVGTDSFQGYFNNATATVDLTGTPQIVLPLCNATATINGNSYQSPATGWPVVFSIDNFNLPTLQLADAPAYIQNSAAAQMAQQQQAVSSVPSFGIGFANMTVVTGQAAPDGWAAEDWTCFLGMLGAYLGSAGAPAWQVTLMNCLVVPSGTVDLVPTDCDYLILPDGQALIVAMCLSGTLNENYADDFSTFAFANPPDPTAQTFVVLSAPTLCNFINAQLAYNEPYFNSNVNCAVIWNEQYLNDNQYWAVTVGGPIVTNTWSVENFNIVFSTCCSNINNGFDILRNYWQANCDCSVALALGELTASYAQSLAFLATLLVSLTINEQSQYIGGSGWSTIFSLQCSGESGLVQLVFQNPDNFSPLPPVPADADNVSVLADVLETYSEQLEAQGVGMTMPQFAFPGGSSFTFESVFLNTVTSLVATLVPTTPGP